MKRNVLSIAAIAIIAVEIMMILAILMLMPQNNGSKGFTELYFNGDLPKEVSRTDKNLFTFSIVNRHESTMSYHYVLYVNNVQITRGVVELGQNQEALINRTFIASNIPSNTSIPVSIRLLDTNDEIHFWTRVK